MAAFAFIAVMASCLFFITKICNAALRQNIPKKDTLFPLEAHDYFDQLRKQYQLLIEQGGMPARLPIPVVVQKALHEADAIPRNTTWGDVFLLQTAYLYAIPNERVTAEWLLYCHRYSEVAGPEAYAEYIQSVKKNIGADPNLLRNELLVLADRIRYLYTFVPPKEAVRDQIAQTAAFVTIGFLGLFVFLLSQVGTLPALFVAMFFGLTGGFLSVQQRLQKSDRVDPLLKGLKLKAGLFSVAFLAPLSGMIFASVLYFLCSSGLLSGDLFPHFLLPKHALQDSYHTQDLFAASPVQITDYAKLLVWAFIAGFAERFVPDVLTRLTGQAETSPDFPARRLQTGLEDNLNLNKNGVSSVAGGA